jgi:hypothetical protein
MMTGSGRIGSCAAGCRSFRQKCNCELSVGLLVQRIDRDATKILIGKTDHIDDRDEILIGVLMLALHSIHRPARPRAIRSR